MQRWLRHLVIIALLVVFIVPSTYVVAQYEANTEVTRTLPAMPEPTSQTRLLVIAPHPDDETLGAGGLIQRVLARGGKVRVIVMTSGDGFTRSAVSYEHVLHPTARDMLALGKDRINESEAALTALGLPTGDVTFLGFPDGGTMTMWNVGWTDAPAYRSPKTGASAVPYARASDYGAPYTSPSVLAQLEAAFTSFQPTEVVLPYPLDEHPDHEAAYLFGSLALVMSQGGWHIPVYGYIVHQGVWPVPLGWHPADELTPPSNLAHDRWVSLALTASEQAKKVHALRAYRSQTSVMAEWIMAFDRRNEIYAPLEPLAVPDASRALFPQSDTLLGGYLGAAIDTVQPVWSKDWERAGDLVSVDVARQGRQLIVVDQLANGPSPEVTYRWRLVTTHAGRLNIYEYRFQDGRLVATSVAGDQPVPAAQVVRGEKHIGLQVAMSDDMHGFLMVHAEALRDGILLSQSAWQWVSLP